MINVGILYGGVSGEHDVSLCSAASVVSGLDKTKYTVTAIGISREGKWHVQDSPVIIHDDSFGSVLKLEQTGDWTVMDYASGKLVLAEKNTGRTVKADVVFPVMHGTGCEDGTIQGFLEQTGVPYVGADTAGSAVGMDKDLSKRLLRDAGLPVVPWEKIDYYEWKQNPEAVCSRLAVSPGLPLFIKPCCNGSSVGVCKVKEEKDLKAALEYSFRFDSRILAEKAVNAREIECAVLGNHYPSASCLGEILPKHEFYSYEAKYLDSAGADLVIPADLDQEVSEKIRNMAVLAFKSLNCSGLARIDFFADRDSGDLYFNEINTMPGFTGISMYPKLWEHSGLPYGDLLDRLIELAFEKHAEKQRTGIKADD